MIIEAEKTHNCNQKAEESRKALGWFQSDPKGWRHIGTTSTYLSPDCKAQEPGAQVSEGCRCQLSPVKQ